MDYTNLNHDSKILNILTGIPSDLLFQWILSLIRSDVQSILKSFTMDNHILIILMKLKLGVSNRDLSLRFNIKEEYVSKIVRTWVPKSANVFAKLIIIWPEREVLRENLPTCFSFLKNCVCIINGISNGSVTKHFIDSFHIVHNQANKIKKILFSHF